MCNELYKKRPLLKIKRFIICYGVKVVRTRKIYFDILRILAILCVIYNHTNKRGYYLYAFEENMSLKVFYIIVAEFIAVGVPLFFMISGALLLGREESILDVYKKRVLRIFLVIAIFSLIQFVYKVSIGDVEFSLKYLADNTINQSIVPSYWFLYTYFAFLIILPFLRKLVKAMSEDDFKYLIILYLLVEGALAMLLYLLGYESYSMFFERPFFDRIIIFPIVGYYLEHVLPREQYNKAGIGKLLIASICTFAIIVAMTLYRNIPYKEFTTYDKGLYTCGLTLVLDITVFYIIKYLFDIKKNDMQFSDGMYKIVTTTGKAVFGVYLVEGNVRHYTEWINTFFAKNIGAFPAALVWVLVIFAISLIISLIMKVIPGLRKLV